MSTVTATVHSILSPSGADRWSTCVGSLAACKGLPERPPGEAAQLGSAKHALGEWVLKNPEHQTVDAHCGQTWYLDAAGDMTAVPADPKTAYKFDIDDTFCDHVNTYVNYVKSLTGVKRFETWVSTAHIFGVEGQGGTIDCLHLNALERQIEIVDAKFGYVPVSARHRQLRIYGAAALALHDLDGEWDTVRCTIVQPQDVSQPVKSEVFTRAEIDAFVADLAPKARKAWELYQNPPADLLQYLTPSDEACAWCPLAERGCVARNNRIVNMFEDTTAKTPDIVLMTDEQLGELYPLLPDIAQWVEELTAEAESRALRGVHIPRNKLVWGRKGKRVYIAGTEETVATTLEMTLGDEMYAPRKLRSPTQVEEALKKAGAPGLYAQIAPFVTQADPKLRLVPETAPGDAVTVAKVEFGVVT